jgi:ribokinase
MARLLVIGSSNTDMTVRLPRLPVPGETVLGGSFWNGPGGKGANQAVAAARAGASVVFVTAVGDDPFGRLSVEGYRLEGIDVSSIRTVPGVASGVALIFVGGGGENMIGVAPGANARLGPDDIERLPAGFFAPERVLLIAGLEVPLETVGRALWRGASAGMRVVLNPAPAFEGLVTDGLLGLVDVITPNRGELGVLTGRPTESCEQVAEAARALRGLGPRGVVVTLGSEGCLVLDGPHVQSIPSYPVEAVDTVGAGDAFSASLAVALGDDCDLVDAAAWASAAAALKVTGKGAQSLPTRAEIDRLAESRTTS